MKLKMLFRIGPVSPITTLGLNPPSAPSKPKTEMLQNGCFLSPANFEVQIFYLNEIKLGPESRGLSFGGLEPEKREQSHV
jgi:hypothetical protein